VRPGRVGVGVVAVADLLGEVLGQVADAPACVLRSGQHAFGFELGAEPGHVVRLVAELVQRLVPGWQDLPGGRVEVASYGRIPDRQLTVVVLDGGGAGPPDLVVGGGQDAADLGPGHGAAHGEVNMRGRRLWGSMVAKYWTS